MEEPVQVLILCPSSSLCVVHVSDSFGFPFDIKVGVVGVLCISQKVFGLFFKNVDVFLMPHGIIDFVYLHFLVVDGAVQLSQIFNVPCSAFVLIDGILPAVLEVKIQILNRLVSCEFSSQRVVVLLESLHVGFVPLVYLDSGQTICIVDRVFGVVLLHDFRQILC